MWQNRITVWRIPIHQEQLLTVLQRFVYLTPGFFGKTFIINETVAYPRRRKQAVLILFIYGILAGLFYWWNEAEPSGPCTPAPGLLGLLGIPFIAGGIALISLFRVLWGEKWAFGRLLGHSLAYVLLFLIIYEKS